MICNDSILEETMVSIVYLNKCTRVTIVLRQSTIVATILVSLYYSKTGVKSNKETMRLEIMKL